MTRCSLSRPWEALREGPVFTLTSDQDWAPTLAATELLARADRWRVPLHVFRTSPCPVFDAAASSGRITQGWHPNFLPGSSHGTTPKEVVSYLETHFPGVRTSRGHAFGEFTAATLALREAGIVVDSHVATAYQAELLPLMHWTGTLRLPVYFEDDVFFDHDPDRLDASIIEKTLFSPGLKVLSFHAIHVWLNTPSQAHYDKVRAQAYSTSPEMSEIRHAGRGTADVLDDLIGRVLDRGHTFVAFEDLGSRVRAEAPWPFPALASDPSKR